MHPLEIIIALIFLGSLIWATIAFLKTSDRPITSTPKTSPQLDVSDLMRDPQEWVAEACTAVEREQAPPTNQPKAFIHSHEYVIPSRKIHKYIPSSRKTYT